MTPSPFGTRPGSVASSSRPRTVRPYRSPSVEDVPDNDEPVPGVAPSAPGRGAVVRNIDDPRQALLHHAETLAALGQAKTKALKDAAAAYLTATDAALDTYQVGLDAHVAALKFLVGLWLPSLVGTLLISW